MPLERAKLTRPFTNCSMDIITDLTPVDRYNSILVTVDRENTKEAILIPITETLTQGGAGQLLLDNLYKQFGLPDKMLSDRGHQFAAMAFRELLKLLGIKSNLMMAYHPQADRATERVNQEIKVSGDTQFHLSPLALFCKYICTQKPFHLWLLCNMSHLEANVTLLSHLEKKKAPTL